MDKTSYKVYIIESPSSQDILDNRKEGIALYESLTLANVPTIYFKVFDKNTLQQVFDRAVTDIQSSEHQIGSITFHFSMHGNSNGIGLTSNEFVSWQDLYHLVKGFNDKVGYAHAKWAPGRKFSYANLNFSVCKGYEAEIMSSYGEESPFTTLLGPSCDIDWCDALIAFTTYYHLTIHKGFIWWDAIRLMNYACGAVNEVVFKLRIADGLRPEKNLILE